jgi:hypothetical protein
MEDSGRWGLSRRFVYLTVMMLVVGTLVGLIMHFRQGSSMAAGSEPAGRSPVVEARHILALATSSTVTPMADGPRFELTSEQRMTAESIVENATDPVLIEILEHPYSVAGIAPSYEAGNHETPIGAMLTIRFAQPVSFVGDLPGSYRSPDGTPMQVEEMTTMYAAVEFATMSIRTATPGQDSIVTVKQPR